MRKIILAAAVLLLAGRIAFADEAVCSENIADEMDFFGYREYEICRLFDNDNTSYYFLRQNYGENTLGFLNETDSVVSHVYIKWAGKPECYTIQKSQDGNVYEDVIEIQTQFLSDLIQVAVEPGEYFRIFVDQSVSERFSIDAIEVYSADEDPLPAHVQRWEETASKADLMIFSAHADDEWVFFGGVIPLYSVEEKKDTLVVYMAANRFYRKSEAISALWSAGLRTYPVFAPFKDYYTYNLEETMDVWGEDDTVKYCVRMIRKYKPDVLLTHDFEGEYGHGTHKMTAYAVDKAVFLAQDASYDSKSAEEYGTWEVKKLYIHLYEENAITMDFNMPLSSFGEMTAYDVSKRALKENLSQLKYTGLVYVHDGEEYSCANWGLRYTSVGLDVEKNSFFENIEKSVLGEEKEEPTASPEPSPEVKETPAVTRTPEPSPTSDISTSHSHAQEEKKIAEPIFLIVYSAVVTVVLAAVVIYWCRSVRRRETRRQRRN